MIDEEATAMPPPVILHQYDFSPFSEKVRLAFGLKGMEWHAVDVPIATCPSRI